jgi:hypothetical protein
MSLNKFTDIDETHDWMQINTNKFKCDGEETHDGSVRIKTQDGLGYNNFSTLTLGSTNQVLETNGSGTLNWVDQSGGGSDPDTIARVQNIKLPETTINNTQIDGTTVLDTVTANTLTLNGNNVETDITNLQTKTTDISYTTNLTTITNSALVTGNLQVNDELQVVTDDLNNLTIKPSTLGTNGQALLSLGSGDVDFGSVVQNPAQSTINCNDNKISDLATPTLDTDAATKIYVDNKIDDSLTTSTTNTWSIDKLNTEFSGSGITSGTEAQLIALTGMTAGQQFYTVNAGGNSQFNKLWTYTGRTWQVIGETVELLARINVVVGNTVQIAGNTSTADFQFEFTNASIDLDVIGVVALEDINSGSFGTIAMAGIWPVKCVADTYGRQNYLVTDTSDGLAKESISEAEQPFAIILQNITVSTGGFVYGLLHSTEIY